MAQTRPRSTKPTAATALPQVRAACGPVRRSTRGRWRALALLGVWALFAVHYLQWYLQGHTLTPLEPSEAMQTLEQGLVNAGFIFFALAILSTLILGRWFCGWGCHLIALQDLCTWLLKKAGLRPKPFRSRLLVYVPLLAALYMFVWPSVVRAYYGQPRPPPFWHLTTYDYWATFPGPAMAILTFLVCGFLIVYVLGNKGFCTYACPYGGFFGVADLVAPGKIRVTDACDACGHCTATCTSNVRVHEEVKRYGMVVDPGCMKCTDCISVCPKEALYFGFGRPTAAVRGTSRKRTYDYSWREEAGLAGVFLLTLYAFRGLYDAVPFLLALGLAGIYSFALTAAARLFYVPSVQLHGVSLRHRGRLTRPGLAFCGLSLALTALAVHSALVQYHAHAAGRLLDEAARLPPTGDSAPAAAIARGALPHLHWVERYGLFPTAKVQAQLGSLYLFLEAPGDARVHLRRALEIAPAYAAARHKYAELIAREGDLAAALAELKRAVHDNPALLDARHDLIAAARRLGALPDTVRVLEDVVRRRPYDGQARQDFAAVLAQTTGKRD